MIFSSTKEHIKWHSLQFQDEECCGFVLENGTIYRAENAAQDKKHRFSICPKSFIDASKLGKIIAIYHSHPNGSLKFSQSDIQNSNNHNLDYIIYSPVKDEFSYYKARSKNNEYTGVDFKIGENDCYSLTKKYYKNELGYDIIDGGIVDGRNNEWLTHLPSVFDDIFKLNKKWLERIENFGREDLRMHDILLFNYFGNAGCIHHIGIYLNNNEFLHHQRRKFSAIEELDEQYFNAVKSVIRLKEQG